MLTPLFGKSLFNPKEKKQSSDVDFYEAVCYFLKKRNTVQTKFFNSDLEKVMIELKNQPLDSWNVKSQKV